MKYKTPNFFSFKRTLFLSASLSASLALASCGGSSATKTAIPQTTEVAANAEASVSAVGAAAMSGLPSIPNTPVEAPASLMAEVVLQNPNAQLVQVATFADAVQPGAGAFITPQGMLQMLAGVLELTSLSGVDLNAPLYILALEGERAVLVVSVANETELNESLEGFMVNKVMHGKFAALGKVDALSEIAPYALSNLVNQSTPALPTLNVYVSKIMKGKHGNDFKKQIRSNMGTTGPEAIGAQGTLDVLDNLNVVRASLDADPKAAKVNLVADVLNGPLKTFLASQNPSDFSMVKRIGTGPWGAIMAGNLDISYFEPTLTKMAASDGDPIKKLILAKLSTLKGEVAVGISVPKPEKPEAILAMNLVDAESIKGLVNMIALGASKDKDLKIEGMKTKVKIASLRSKSGSIHEIKFIPSTKDQIKQFGKKGMSAYVGVVSDTLIGTYGKRAKMVAKTLMNPKKSLSGKGKQLELVIQSAIEHKESLFIAMDPIGLQGNRPITDIEPVVFSVGFTDTKITGRIVFPTAFAKEATSGKL